jgi:NTP pyrophosphatase (non-canonical NTP hydrolase)
VTRAVRGRSLRDWQTIVTEYAVNHGFDWTTEEVDTMLLRIHSEVSEAGEALRDDDVTTFAEELADIFIRLVNCAEVMGVDLEREVIAKHAKNVQRPHLHGKHRK